MTRIHSPNRRSHACNFGYKDLELPHLNFRTIPNFPYYGLGPLDDSPCDTLGIDNPVPTARFEYWQEDSTANFVEFFDASHFAYEWEWSFGDQLNTTSMERHPVFTYQEPGAYEVCLTASNLIGSDTWCQTILVGPVKNQELQEGTFQIFPNPVREVLYLSHSDPSLQQASLLLFDASGRQVLHQVIRASQEEFPVSHLPAGVYSFEIWERGVRIGQGKVVKL